MIDTMMGELMELPVALSLTRACVSEAGELDRMTELLFGKEPGLKNRCGYLRADKGLDSAALKKKLWDDCLIRPIIDSRGLWRQEKQGQSYVEGQKIMRPLGNVHDNIFCTERAEGLVSVSGKQYGAQDGVQGF